MKNKKVNQDASSDSVSTFDNLITTGFGAGYFPWGPGTAGAAVALLVWVLMAYVIEPIAESYAVVQGITSLLTFVFFCTYPIIDKVEKVWGPDPKRVVVDEMVGVWFALVAVPPTREWYWPLAAFILFRIFDIWKPLGIRWIDRNIHGGIGVMLDDVLAGVYAMIVLLIVRLVA